MHVRTPTGGPAAALVVSVPLLDGPAAAAPSSDTAAPPAAARVPTHDASGSAEFASAADREGDDLERERRRRRTAPGRARAAGRHPGPGGRRAAARPARPLGEGTVRIGRQAGDQGCHTVRVSAHELGHIPGLPDRKPGPCSRLTSGSSAGVPCANPLPERGGEGGGRGEHRGSGLRRAAGAAGRPRPGLTGRADRCTRPLSTVLV
ncbi:Extracellular small neutral protease OS=Streptomyces griseomycini OX=66895 GN=FHS37_005387 PE=3 SV=1 [Streptomyces griseomycini]|uniref:Extracellular small neutral protease n=1 Tax=Streptomyces griseomycini TaxID=66895 RepID=A0A7W7PU37_9ACTN|nr:snapalysin [Streptomyces griseomycini]GGR23733.1 peptidase [Streptomyces griseomycini]